jgi:hypothetical protein
VALRKQLGRKQSTGRPLAGGISRNDQLRIIGNGVCPQQAIAALHCLLNVCEIAA